MNKVVVLLSVLLLNCVSKQSNTTQKIKKAEVDNTVIVGVKKHFDKITKTEKPRNHKNVAALNAVATYIKEEFNKVCDSTGYQDFLVEGKIYKNVIGALGTQNKERIIIGAHYDVCGTSDGADDNASGVVGLLELAKKLSKENLKYRIDFVAYSLEEPPYFRTKQMGSYIHAKYLYDNEIPVKGMLCLESIGYFSDEANSQEYPLPGLSLKYGNKGNFITVVQNASPHEFSEQVKLVMLNNSLIKTEAFKGVSSVSGVDYSDHLNYWEFNYDAVMITDTAFLRNKNYHTEGDVVETLNLEKMCLVIEQVFQTIKKIN